MDAVGLLTLRSSFAAIWCLGDKVKNRKANENSDQDSAWKEMLDEYLPWFLEFFFPQAYAEIDWSRGYESLDKELAKILPDDRTGKLLADKLFKVWLFGGREIWLLIHIEIQVRSNRSFNKRVFVYNYRLMNAHQVEVVSLVVLTGENPGLTGQYKTDRWGCSHHFQFPFARIIDYKLRWKELDASLNPFAMVVKSQLKALETKGDNEQRYEWKRRLIFELYRKGYQRDQIINLFRFMDWVVSLPYDLDQKIKQEVYDYEKGKNMPYVTSFERSGIQQALHETIALMLASKFGEYGEKVKTQLQQLSIDQLKLLSLALLNFQKKSDLNTWLKENRVATNQTS